MGWAKNGEDKKTTGEGGDVHKDSTWGGSLGGAGWGPETGGSGKGAGTWAAKNGVLYPGGNPRKLTPGPALPFFPPRVFFEIGSTTTTLTIRQATPEYSGKYEV